MSGEGEKKERKRDGDVKRWKGYGARKRKI